MGETNEATNRSLMQPIANIFASNDERWKELSFRDLVNMTPVQFGHENGAKNAHKVCLLVTILELIRPLDIDLSDVGS